MLVAARRSAPGDRRRPSCRTTIPRRTGRAPRRASRLGGNGCTACRTFGLLGAHSSASKRDRRLHRGHRQQLEQVIGHHVAQRAGRFVEFAAALHADDLGHRDLDMVDAVAVPDWLEHAVGKAQRHDVLHGLLAEEMIDAVDLLFREHCEQLPVERLRRDRDRGRTAFRRSRGASPVAAPALPPARSRRGVADDRRERTGRRRQIEQAIAGDPALRLDLRQRLVETLDRRRHLRNRPERRSSARSAISPQLASSFSPVCCSSACLSKSRETSSSERCECAKPTSANASGRCFCTAQIIERRHDQPRRSDRQWRRRSRSRRAAASGVGRCHCFLPCGLAPAAWARHGRRILCASPTAASIAKLCSARANGTGHRAPPTARGAATASSIAASIVQRPSPESST